MAGFADDDAIEHTLCQIRTVHVFKIPPRTTSGGHRASDWSQEVWQGSLKIVEKRKEAAILLTDPKDGSLFAMCPVKDGAVERTVDSSRYYVFKIQNAQGRHAFIGVAFNEREEAFDFNVALQEYEKDKQRDEAIANGTFVSQEVSGPSKDYSLKEGQKISIKLPASSGDAPVKKRAAGTGGGLLAPPPGSGGLLAPPPGPSSRPAPRPTVSSSTDPFGNFSAPAPKPSPSSSSTSGFDDFDAFTSPSSGPKPSPPRTAGMASFDPLGGFGAAPPANSTSSASPLDAWGAMNAALPSQPQAQGQIRSPAKAPAAADPFADFLS